MQQCIFSWCRIKLFTILEPGGWLTTGRGGGVYLRALYPASIENAPEMFPETIHKLVYRPHIVLCPLMMTHLWHKKIVRGVLLPGPTFWPRDCHKLIQCKMLLPIIGRTKRKGGWVIQILNLLDIWWAHLDRVIKTGVKWKYTETIFAGGGICTLNKIPAQWSQNIIQKVFLQARTFSTYHAH